MGFVRNGHTGVLFLLSLLLHIVLIVAKPTSRLEVVSTSTLSSLDDLPKCAVDCLIDAVGDSECLSTDVDCICADKDLNKDIATCVHASCSVREYLSFRNTTSHLCGVHAEADDEIIPVFAVFISFTLVAVGLRVLARILTKAYFWWDDLCNLFGLVGCIAFTAINIKQVEYGFGLDIWWVDHDHITLVLKLFYVDMLLYTITRFFVRASIILFYLRVFPARSDTNLRPILIWTMVANLVYNLAFFFAVIFQCQPISFFWTQWEGLMDGHCGNVNVLAWVAAISGLVFDFWLLALPFPQLMSLNVHWKKKLMGSVMFGVGASVMVISLVRLKTINEFTRAVNPTKDIVQVCIWSGIEIDVGVICPCLPSFRLLLRKMWPRLTGSSVDTAVKYEMRSRSNRQSSGITGSTKPRTALRSKSTGSGSMKRKHAEQTGNTPGTIILTTEVGVEFEMARQSTVASGGESMASVSTFVESDGESIHHGIQHGTHHNHGHDHGRGGNSGAASFV